MKALALSLVALLAPLVQAASPGEIRSIAALPSLPSAAPSAAAAPILASPAVVPVAAPAIAVPAAVPASPAAPALAATPTAPTDEDLKTLFRAARPGSKTIGVFDGESGFVSEATELVSQYTFIGNSLHSVLARSNPAYRDPDYAEGVRELAALSDARTQTDARRFVQALGARRAHDIYLDLRTSVRVQTRAAADVPAERPRHLPRNALGSGDYWDMASGLNAANFLLENELEPGTHYTFFDVSPFVTSYLRTMAALTRSAVSIVEKDVLALSPPEKPLAVLRTKNAVNYVAGFETKLEEMAFWVAPGGGRLVIQHDPGYSGQREAIAEKHETLAVSLLEEGWDFSYDFASQAQPKHLLDTLIFTRPADYSVPPRSRFEAEGMWDKYRMAAEYIGRRDPL